MLGHPVCLPERQDFSTAVALKIIKLFKGEVNKCSQWGDTECAVLFLKKSHIGWGPRAGTWRTSHAACHLSIFMLLARTTAPGNETILLHLHLWQRACYSLYQDAQNSSIMSDLCLTCMPRDLTYWITILWRKQRQLQTWLLLCGFVHVNIPVLWGL